MLGQSGNMSNVGYNANIIKTTYNGTSNPTKAAASRNVADNDAAVAIIQNPLQTETAGLQQNTLNDNITITNIIKENLLKLRELASKLDSHSKEFLNNAEEPNTSGVLERLKKQLVAFNANGVLERLKKEIEAFNAGGGNLEHMKETIEIMLAFEGFFLGVHERIDEYTKFMHFRLEQITNS